MKNKNTEKISLHNLESKWSYKTAIGIATESITNEEYELICVVETSKILLKNDKNEKKEGNL